MPKAKRKRQQKSQKQVAKEAQKNKASQKLKVAQQAKKPKGDPETKKSQTALDAKMPKTHGECSTKLSPQRTVSATTVASSPPISVQKAIPTIGPSSLTFKNVFPAIASAVRSTYTSLTSGISIPTLNLPEEASTDSSAFSSSRSYSTALTDFESPSPRIAQTSQKQPSTSQSSSSVASSFRSFRTALHDDAENAPVTLTNVPSLAEASHTAITASIYESALKFEEQLRNSRTTSEASSLDSPRLPVAVSQLSPKINTPPQTSQLAASTCGAAVSPSQGDVSYSPTSASTSQMGASTTQAGTSTSQGGASTLAVDTSAFKPDAEFAPFSIDVEEINTAIGTFRELFATVASPRTSEVSPEVTAAIYQSFRDQGVPPVTAYMETIKLIKRNPMHRELEQHGEAAKKDLELQYLRFHPPKK